MQHGKSLPLSAYLTPDIGVFFVSANVKVAVTKEKCKHTQSQAQPKMSVEF